MSDLFDRVFGLEVANRRFSSQRISFEVEKTLKPDPNTATIKIYNLNDTERKELTHAKTPLVRLFAGYRKTKATQIFYGQLVHVEHSVEGPDVITTLSTGDGIVDYQTARVSATFGPGTKADTVFRTLVKALKLKPGNAERAIASIVKSKAATIYLQGTTLSGSAAHEMTQLCRSANLDWSIQDGTAQFVDLVPLAAKFATVLAPDTGLIGSPTLSNRGVISGKCLILPDMIPGRQIQVTSKFVVGAYRLEKVKYSGDNFDNDWYCEFEGVPVYSSASLAALKKKAKKSK